jgi:ribose transport system substrate-binding protein
MEMRKEFVVSILLALSILILPASTGNAGEYRLAFAIKNLTNPFFINIAASAEQTAKEAGATINIQATESDKDIEKMSQILQTFLTQHYDAIIVNPLSSSAIVPFIKECNDTGVPIILFDTRADEDELVKLGAKMDAFVAADNFDAGVKAAEIVVEALGGKGDIAILEGTAGSASGKALHDGMLSVLDKTDIKIVASQAADFNRNMGYDVAQSILTAHPEINAILAANDEMALGAINALKHMGFEGVKVIGINNAPDAQEAMRMGDMYATVDKSAKTQGRLVVQRALDIINGKSVPAEEYLECFTVWPADVK